MVTQILNITGNLQHFLRL